MSKTSPIPAFESTAIEAIAPRVAALRSTYMTTKTKDVNFRINQIRKLYWALCDNTELMEKALMQDFRKCNFEARISEIEMAKEECLFALKNIKSWTKDSSIAGVKPMFWPMRHRIRYEPYGVVLIMPPYNYPLMIAFCPLISAIGAGNCAVVKPSETSPATAMVINKIITETLDPDCFACINGNVPVTQALLDVKWDKILFTGGQKVGTIVATKAAETLTPVILELGGMSPAFVTKNSNINIAARRLMWSKSFNSGQVCMSQNYALVQRSVLNDFIAAINAQYKNFFPKGAKASPDYSRIVNINHFKRQKTMLDNTKGKIVMGGGIDESDLFIEPTVVLVDSIEDSMITEETFGPAWSILPYDTLDEAIAMANKVDPTPLTLFTFGSNAENEKVLNSVTSGGATVNDAFMHSSVIQAPFGGVGSSGSGSYHGHFGFRAFSHERVIANVPSFLDKALTVRYMPYSMKQLRAMASTRNPGFDRQGNTIKGLSYWLGFVLSLGTQSTSTAILRWGLLAAIAALLQSRRASAGL